MSSPTRPPGPGATPSTPPPKKSAATPRKKSAGSPASTPDIDTSREPMIAAASLEKRTVPREAVDPARSASSRKDAARGTGSSGNVGSANAAGAGAPGIKALPVERSPEERQRLIARAAYFRSESRGFAPGYEHEDWLAAEREVDSGGGGGKDTSTQ